MRPLRMDGDGLHVYVDSPRDDEPSDWVRIADPFSTPARVSDPRTGGAYGLLVEFLDERRRPKQTVVSAASLHGNPRDICSALSNLGLYIDREHQATLLDYLQGRMMSAASADLATTPGWISPETYVLPDKIYGAQDNGRAVHYAGDTRDHTYRTRGTLAEWQGKVARPCDGNSRAVTVLSAAFAGPLMADAAESSGGFHLWSKSTTGKTTLLIVGGSVCGGGDPRTGFVSSWRTTANGLEPLLSAHNDSAIFIDEIAQADARGISELVYTAANSAGKHRMTRDLTSAPSLHWRALIVSSGEHTIAAHARGAGVTLAGGAAVRLIDIPADAGKGLGVFEDIHGRKSAGDFADELRAAALECYGVAFREYLRCLAGMPAEDRRAIIADYRDQSLAACNLTGACPEVRRAGNRMGAIAAAGELAIAFDILPWEPGAAIDGVRTCFAAWRESRGGDTIGHDDARAIEHVRLFVERYSSSRFEALPPSSAASDRVTDRAGWRRRAPNGGGTEYLVQPEFFRAEMCKGFDPVAVARALHARGNLRRQGRHWTVRTTIPGSGKRELYCILDTVLSDAAEVSV